MFELSVYSQLPFAPLRGQGCWLHDADGNRYLDMYGGHAVALTGHCHPHVVEAIARQARELLFYSNAVPSPLRDAASELLLKHAPHPRSRVFYCCSGSEANDNALKMARKITGRRKIVSFENGFHGRTLATLSATGMAKYRATAGPVLVEEHAFVPMGAPHALEKAVDADTAAVICEPIQSVAGLYTAAPEFHQKMAAIAAAAGALVLFDELQTGLGRCGRFFFADSVGVKPDIITLAKGLASGVPCGAVIASPKIAEQIKIGDLGSTFGGGQIPMAAMKATLEVIEREHLVRNAAERGQQLRHGMQAHSGVRELRGMGLLLGIETGRPAAEIQKAFLDKRVVVGTSSQPNVIRLMPPLTISAAEIDTFLSAAREVLS